MNLRENKSALIGAAVVLLILGGVYVVDIRPKRVALGAEILKQDKLRGNFAAYRNTGPGKQPLAQLTRVAQNTRTEVEASLKRLDQYRFTLPPEYAKQNENPLFAFQTLRDGLYDELVQREVTGRGKSKDLGFSALRQRSTDGNVTHLMRRLGLLKRFFDAARLDDPLKRRFDRLVGVKHPDPPVDDAAGGSFDKVPIDVTIKTTERKLIQLLQDLQNPALVPIKGQGRSYVGLDRITIEVTDPGAGVFSCTLRIFGLFPYDEAAAKAASLRSPAHPAERVFPAGGDRDI